MQRSREAVMIATRMKAGAGVQGLGEKAKGSGFLEITPLFFFLAVNTRSFQLD